MMTLVATGLKVLLAELAGVALMTGILYVYWNTLTKDR